MEDPAVKQKRRMPDIEEAAHAPHDDFMIAARISGFSHTFEVCDTAGEQRHAVQATMEFDADKLVSRGACELARQGFLVERNNIDREWITNLKMVIPGGGIGQAPENEWRIQGKGTEGIDGHPGVFASGCNRRHDRDPGGKLPQDIAELAAGLRPGGGIDTLFTRHLQNGLAYALHVKI
jgi:hypothetical protein